jgi:hypothetical protein
LIFALALFMRAKALPADTACTCLKPHLAGLLRRALHDLGDDTPAIIAIRQALASGEDSQSSAAS